MKKHFNDQTGCAHAWAHGHYSEGHASNFFFDGPVIYSYGRHFPIAYINGRSVYFTLQRYSITTATHKNIALSAISHKNIIYVHNVPTTAFQLTSSEWIKGNIDYWIKRITEILNQIQSFPRRKKLLIEIETHKIHLLAFIENLNIEVDATLTALLNEPTISNIQAFTTQLNRKTKIDLLKKHRREVREWRKGIRQQISYANIPGVDSSLAYLRFDKTNNRIETSKGVKIPVEIARRFWAFIQRQLPAGCTDCEYSILDFKVDYIKANVIKVGCHTIPMNEAKSIAKRLKW